MTGGVPGHCPGHSVGSGLSTGWEFTNDFTTFHLLQMLAGDFLIVTGLFAHGVNAVKRAAAG
ncbi:hypothetical protein [Citrobacter werkmanii]|uniref:hypothetical protein n=1 Tax=Citrobacter werkmanii TaxID=67827 RepID=UPI001D08FB2B|nr:hypothetical protein [Citrobacter werkmanii]UCA27581.1 hypothetical protein LA356_23840 [Citrobacter werkmanii]